MSCSQTSRSANGTELYFEAAKHACQRCLRTGRDCVVTAESRRGRWKRRPNGINTIATTAVESDDGKTGTQAAANTSTVISVSPHWIDPPENTALGSIGTNLTATTPWEQIRENDLQQPLTAFRSIPGEELKNPADALDILCHAAGQNQSEAPSRANSPILLLEEEQVDTALGSKSVGQEQASTALQLRECCLLITAGYLTVDKLRQLTETFIRFYHPFYPLLATVRLSQGNLARFAHEEPVLLPAICVIASLGLNDVHLHHLLWQHTKTLLTETMWGEKASVGAVEAMLLLSEWIGPGFQLQAKQRVKDTSAIWMMVGSVSRILILFLDLADRVPTAL